MKVQFWPKSWRINCSHFCDKVIFKAGNDCNLSDHTFQSRFNTNFNKNWDSKLVKIKIRAILKTFGLCMRQFNKKLVFSAVSTNYCSFYLFLFCFLISLCSYYDFNLSMSPIRKICWLLWSTSTHMFVVVSRQPLIPQKTSLLASCPKSVPTRWPQQPTQ